MPSRRDSVDSFALELEPKESNMKRLELYTTVHKGLRSALFAAAERIARTNFADPAAAREVAGSLGFLLDCSMSTRTTRTSTSSRSTSATARSWR
jgi:hypothetical protein